MKRATAAAPLVLAALTSLAGDAAAEPPDLRGATSRILDEHAEGERSLRLAWGASSLVVGGTATGLGVYLMAQKPAPPSGYILAGGGVLVLATGALVFLTGDGMETLAGEHRARVQSGRPAADVERETEHAWQASADSARTLRRIGGGALVGLGVVGVGTGVAFTLLSPLDGVSSKEMRGYGITGMLVGAVGLVGGGYLLTHRSLMESSLRQHRAARAAPPTVSWGATPLPGGAAVGVSGTF